MKKYTLFVFILAFVFGVFNNSVSAANCAPGDLFSTTTGQACATNSTVVSCPSGDLFSSVTGQRCTAWQDNSNSSDVTQFNNLFRSYFAVGTRGQDIISLQRFLKNQGYYFGIVDGKYGKITARAVSDFRDDNNISVVVNTYNPPVTPINPTTTTPPSTTQSPVISGVSGPQSLNVSEQGTWTVSSYDSNGGNLSYSVNWTDQQHTTQSYGTTSTFSHSYKYAGIYTPIFIVTNSSGQTAQTSLSVKVGNTTTPSVTVLSPNGGEVWQSDMYHEIKWTSANLDNSNFCLVALDVSSGNSGNVINIAQNLPNTGSYNWFVTNGLQGVYKMKVSPCGGSLVEDQSNFSFTITSSTVSTIPSVTVTPPNWETVTRGSIQKLEWNRAGSFPLDSVQQIRLSNRWSVYPLFSFPAGNTQTSYNWTVGMASDGTFIPDGSGYKIQVLIQDNAGTALAFDESPYFIIAKND